MKLLVGKGQADPPVVPQSTSFDYSRYEITEEEINSEVQLLQDVNVLRPVVIKTGQNDGDRDNQKSTDYISALAEQHRRKGHAGWGFAARVWVSHWNRHSWAHVRDLVPGADLCLRVLPLCALFRSWKGCNTSLDWG
jgi:hypothetical protein